MGKAQKYDHMKLIREYAGGHRHLITVGRCFAAISAVMTLIPYYELWKIIKCAVNGEDTDRIRVYAWSAVGMIVGALLVYILALLCTHIAAFRVQANMRNSLMRRIITLPLGVFDEDGTFTAKILNGDTNNTHKIMLIP